MFGCYKPSFFLHKILSFHTRFIIIGFRKILKKHDKNLNTDTGAKWRSEHVDSAMFYTNKDIDKLIQDTENAFIQDLEAGDRQKAMKRLRVPPLGDKQSPWTTFKVNNNVILSVHNNICLNLY